MIEYSGYIILDRMSLRLEIRNEETTINDGLAAFMER